MNTPEEPTVRCDDCIWCGWWEEVDIEILDERDRSQNVCPKCGSHNLTEINTDQMKKTLQKFLEVKI